MTKKLSIGLVLDSSLDLEDGVQQYVMTVGEWLRERGHDVHYLVGQTNKRDLPNIHSLSRNIVVSFNGNRVDLPLAANKHRIRDLMERQPFDILHVQTPHHPLLAQRVIMAAAAQTGVVASFHILPYGRLASYSNRLLGWWLRPSLKRIDQMLAVTPAAAEFEERTFGLPAEISPNVFRYGSFQSASPLPKYQDGKPTILFLGRLVPRKGCRVLLEAARLLKKRSDMPDFRLLICGKGPMESELKTYAAEHGLADRVEFTGFVSDEDKPHYYASADIAVFPSSGGESFGIVLLEAMASGKAAVLAGDNPGYRSVMGGRPELLFDPVNPQALAERLGLLLVDDATRRADAAWGSAYSRQFDVEVVGRQLEALYERLHAAKQLP